MYIIVVNPSILQRTGMPFSGVLTATILVSAFSSVMMGLYAKNPILLAPGMGLNAFFTYSVVAGMGVAWEVALGAVFWSGIIFLLLSIFNVRTLILRAIPQQIRFAVAAGIGLFIALIGFANARFIVHTPGTILGFGGLDSLTLTFVVGLFLTATLVTRRVKGALILGIIATTLLAIPIGRLWGDATEIFGAATVVNWNGLVAPPDLGILFRLDLVHSLRLSLWPVIFAFLFTDMFDSLSTFVGLAEAAELKDEDGEPRNVKESLIVDAIATTTAGLLHRIRRGNRRGWTHRGDRDRGWAFVPAFSVLLAPALGRTVPRHRAGPGAGGSVHGQTHHQDPLVPLRRCHPGISGHAADSSDLLDHPGNRVGLSELDGSEATDGQEGRGFPHVAGHRRFRDRGARDLSRFAG
jgi:hypothetical protein